MEEKINKVKEILKKYNQEHLLINFENLDEKQKKDLLEQILEINFEQMNNLYKKVGETLENAQVKVEPIKYVDKTKLTESEKQKYCELGVQTLKKGKLAVVTMAGGQGTRLRTYWS